MKRMLCALMLFPAAVWAQGKDDELAQCSQIFRDNMNIVVFPMRCTGVPPAQPLAEEKLENHLRQTQRCEDLLAGKYAANAQRIERELQAYVLPVAEEVRRLQRDPQAMLRFCEAQHRRAYETLMKY
ncbi:hypothetical protein [Neisseria shayeganii]|uniref:Periplasmic protein n=1 Tax=Neisseria shayeganii 871 TaxID=1032488 RepID=G4CFI5_9NEIS|nr:hypothetical protein [Neisseria shayeganii]EGY53449.1 hypothetical protein HMPREF9371_0374 [Neisseria shayeganii 871]